MSGDSDKLTLANLVPAGPVWAAFVNDRSSLVKTILGPVGGGKTVACIYDSIRSAGLMTPCNDGVIRYRRAIIGSTYGQIERNLYPSWWRYVPPKNGWTTGEFRGGGGRFAQHRLEWEVARSGKRVVVKAEYIFAALGDQVVEEFMRGFEPTDFWGYEIDQLPEGFLNVGLTRIGRYPASGDKADAVRKTGRLDADGQEIPAFRSTIIGDLNAPDVDSWFYRKFEEEKPQGFRVYRQPGGMTPQAENLANLPAGYYARQRQALSGQQGGRNLAKRMIDAQYGPSSAGLPVWQDEWNDDLHFAKTPLDVLKGRGIYLGFDQDLHPACMILQQASNGQFRVLAEVVPGRCGERRFAELVRMKIAERCPGERIVDAFCDPAGFTGRDEQSEHVSDTMSWAEIVAAELGIVINPAPSNDVSLRLTAVRDELAYMIDATTPAIVFDLSCTWFRKGAVSNYMYDKRPAEKSQMRSPVKNPWSNPQDALQYILLGIKGRFGTIQGRRDARDPSRAINGVAADDGACVVVEAPAFEW